MKNAKKITSVILTIVLLLSTLSCIPFSAFAATQSGECGENATYTYDSSTATLTISGTGAMEDYRWNEIPWRSLNDSVENIVIKNGITVIGTYAFYQFNKITSVEIPNSVTEINFGAFMGCVSLTNVTLSNKLIKIGNSAFSKCPFTSISLPNTLQSIGWNAFDSTGLTKITIPSSVTIIGKEAFKSCKSLKEIRVLSKDSYIYPSVNNTESEAIIYGYSGSTAETYAKLYGKTFVDLETNKKTVYTITNNELVSLLPTNIKCAEPSMVNLQVVNGITGKFDGYMANILHESNTNNSDYKAIKAKTEEIISGKESTYDKAVAISKWVNSNMKYVYSIWTGTTIDSVYREFNELSGNCMCFTTLTNYMLYLAGIPNAIIHVYDHEYSAALVDGKWLKMDSTSGYISYDFGDYYDIEAITFSTPDYLTMVIDSKVGVALAGVNCSYEYDIPETITIPSYVNYIYEICLSINNKSVTTIKGTKGSYAETWCKTNYPYITYSGNTFTASRTGLGVPKITSVANTTTGVNISWGKINGAEKYRVFYKADGESTWHKAGDTTSTSLNWTGAKSGTKYTFTVRCMDKNGTKYTSAYDTTGKSITYIAAPNLSSVANAATGIEIKWSKVTGAAQYRVFYKENGESTWHKAGDTTSTSFTWTKAVSGTKYAFTVRCLSSDGSSYTSAYNTTGKSITYVAAPKISSLSNTTTGVQIKWDKVTGAAKYRVFYKANGESSWHKAGDTTSTSFIWTKAVSGTKYAFTVRCLSKDGNTYTSAYDTTGKSITYIAAPEISSLSKSSSGITIKWGKVAGAENYRVFYKESGESTWHKAGDTTSTSLTWNGGKTGTTYVFTVRCMSKDGSTYTSGYDTTGKSITK